MKLQPASYDGHTIKGGDLDAIFPANSLRLGPSQRPTFISRPDLPPVMTHTLVEPKVFTLVVFCEGTLRDQIDQLKGWFDPTDPTEKKLIAQDADDGAKQWYIYAATQKIVAIQGSAVTIQMSASDAVWREEVASTDTWSITATGATKNITPGGNLPARPRFKIKPTSARASDGFAYAVYVAIHNPCSNGLARYFIDLTDGGWDTAALVTGGKCQANGDDIWVFIDGVPWERWLDAMNTDHTKVWAVLEFQPAQITTVGVATGAGALTKITVENTSTNKNALRAMPPEGILLIDDEIFTYTGIDESAKQFTGVTRATRGTSAANHTVGTSIYWLQHDIWVLYGNSTLSAPEVDDSNKPIIDLSSSTNTSWVYAVFTTDERERPGSWEPTVPKSRATDDESDWYTGNHDGEADPATEMGMRIGAYRRSGSWASDTAQIVWSLFHPCGVTTISSNGEKWRNSTSWPATAALQKSSNGTRWNNVWNEATPGSASSWTAWNHAAAALGATYNHLRFFLSGTMTAGEDYAAKFEVDAVTLTLDSTQTPVVDFGSEQGGYHLMCRITNNLTGEWIEVDVWMDTNQEFVVDTANKEAYYALDNTPGISALDWSSIRYHWLDLLPGVVNELQFDDVGTGNVTITIEWEDRSL